MPAASVQIAPAKASTGTIKDNPAMANSRRGNGEIAVLKKPIIAIETSQIPAIAVAMVRAMSAGPAFKSRLGENTNMNGITKADQPNRIAAKAVFIGSVLATVAAANAPMAIGGVIIDIMPKYST